MSKIDTERTKLATCPYCGHQERDSWEIGTGGEEDTETWCGSCGLLYAVSRHVSISYSTRPVVQDEMPSESRAAVEQGEAQE